ncbi:MAG: ATP-dependent chaperone ClpB [Ignavibacteriales bacterium]|nr:ATP-dependent chaperone ClpB [Ignavibacteriales bacterium]
MNLNKFTVKAQELVQKAIEIAESYSHQSLEPEHLLAALVEEKGSVAEEIVRKAGGNPDHIRLKAAEALERLPKVSGAALGEQRMSRPLSKVFDAALKEAKTMKDEYVSTEHLLMGLVESEGEAGRLLRDQGVTKDVVLGALRDVRGDRRVTDRNAEDSYQALNKFGRDLNELAESGKLDPVIGRDEEIRRVLQVLARRSKNNPVLIGEPGVGKTAIAEGIAHRIVSGDAPETLRDKRIVALDIGALVAGAQFRGQFEERVKSVVKEVVDSDGRIILFIDEMHMLVGAGKAEGAVDAANILKPALARGELHCVGATTLDEYKKHIEKDAALERRFQQVYVPEPSEEDSVSILRGLKERYEVHHGVRISDGAIVAAAQLSNRYIADRFLPDKAIDLIDEAASKMRIEIDSLPEELDALERRVRQLEIEREALKRETDEASAARLKDLEKELDSLKTERDKLRVRWNAEKDRIHEIQTIREEIDRLKLDAERYEREGDLGKVAEIRYGKIVGLEKRLAAETEKLGETTSQNRMLKEEVTAEDVAEVVAKWTGIPVSRMLESERAKLLRLEDEMHKRVVGQDDAVVAVANAVRRSRSGLQDSDRPIGSFIFLGSTGVGKTELARTLAATLFDDEHAMVRVDMSEYMEKHSVSRLIGAPPGYVGYEEGGQLTERVRRRPYSVVLLDEIEKAHPEVFNVLLQVLDEGRLTDNKGRTVDFRNTIIVMTSNLGSQLIQERLANLPDERLEGAYDPLKDEVFGMLRKTIRPEFVNRIDEIVLFKPLRKSEIREVVDIQLRRVKEMLAKKRMKLKVSDQAKDWMAEVGYDPTFGARPLKRTIQNHLVNPLSRELLMDAFAEGDVILVSRAGEGDGLAFRKE